MAGRQEKPKLQLSDASNMRIGIVRSAFHTDITAKQLEQAKECLAEYNIEFDVAEVAGCFEITYVLRQMAKMKKYDGLVALGCLVKGATVHFDVIAQAVSSEIMHMVNELDIPIGFGIITALTREQAEKRTWFGYDATYAVIETLSQVEKLKHGTD